MAVISRIRQIEFTTSTTLLLQEAAMSLSDSFGAVSTTRAHCFTSLSLFTDFTSMLWTGVMSPDEMHVCVACSRRLRSFSQGPDSWPFDYSQTPRFTLWVCSLPVQSLSCTPHCVTGVNDCIKVTLACLQDIKISSAPFNHTLDKGVPATE